MKKQASSSAFQRIQPDFNLYVGGGDYSRDCLLELVLLGLTDIDADGNIFPELAAELPTS